MTDDQAAAAIAQAMSLQPRPLGGEWNARTAKGARLIIPPGTGLLNGQGHQL